MEHRIGIGYDIHRLMEGRALFIGGVEIPYVKGLLGHSDGDVLLHAICDAILGAAGQKDIGELFPNTDSQYENIASVKLLQEVINLVQSKGFKISNIDTVIVAEAPPIAPFKNKIRQKLSEILNIPQDRINIKAKTNEGLDSIGSKEAIASYAVAILTAGG